MTTLQLSIEIEVGQPAASALYDRADPRAVFLFRYEPVTIVRALGQPIASRAPDGVSPIVYRLPSIQNPIRWPASSRFVRQAFDPVVRVSLHHPDGHRPLLGTA
jgi:hypothetical protein